MFMVGLDGDKNSELNLEVSLPYDINDMYASLTERKIRNSNSDGLRSFRQLTKLFRAVLELDLYLAYSYKGIYI